MTGRIHSIESMGLVDGPGVRSVVFLQGCPLRCLYCHNPDTQRGGGQEISAQELCRRLVRFRPYFGDSGGVTFSGGEPLGQPEFLLECLRHLKAEGIHTCLDTSGVGLGDYGEILAHTDLVLYDVKHFDPQGYRAITGRDMDATLAFVEAVRAANVPMWVRHVVVPGLNDNLEDLRAIKTLAESFPNLEKIEWLPFHNLCLEKYQQMGIPFPLEGTDNLDDRRLEELVSQL